MGIARPVMEQFPYAWAFFIPFILVATFTSNSRLNVIRRSITFKNQKNLLSPTITPQPKSVDIKNWLFSDGNQYVKEPGITRFHPLSGTQELRIIRTKLRSFVPANDRLPKQHPIVDVISGEERAHPLPQRRARTETSPRLLKEPTAALLDLVDEKSQHHQQEENGC